MKLTYLLLLLVAQQATPSPKTTEDHTSKRELVEGNHGDQNHKRQAESNDANQPGIQYADDAKEVIPDIPAGPVFGARWPQISKISDLLSGADTPFDVALVNNLHSPIPVYQTRLQSPATFGFANEFVPVKVLETNPKFKSQIVPKEVEQKFKVYSDPTTIEPKQYENINTDTNILTNQESTYQARPENVIPIQQKVQQPEQKHFLQVLPSYYQQNRPFFPIYEHPRTFHQNAQFLHQQTFSPIVPRQPSIQYQQVSQKVPEDGSQAAPEEPKAEPTGIPRLEPTGFVPRRGYHSHPNGAISFASFTHNLPYTDLKSIKQQQHDLGEQQKHQQLLYQQQQLVHQKQEQQENKVSIFKVPLETKLKDKEPKYILRPAQYIHQPEYQEQAYKFYQAQTPQAEAYPQENVYTTQRQPKKVNPLQMQLLVSSLQSLQNIQTSAPLLQPHTFNRALQQSAANYQLLAQNNHLPYHFVPHAITNQNPKLPSLSTQSPSDSFSDNSLVQSKANSPDNSYTNYYSTVQPLTPTRSTSKTETESDQLVLSSTVQPEVTSRSEGHNVQPREQEHSEQGTTLSSLLVQPLPSTTTVRDDTKTTHSTVRPLIESFVDIQRQELQEFHSELQPQPRFYQHQPSVHQQFGRKIVAEQQQVDNNKYSEEVNQQTSPQNNEESVESSTVLNKQEQENAQTQNQPTESIPQVADEHNQSEVSVNATQDSTASGQYQYQLEHNHESLQNQLSLQKQFQLQFVPIGRTESPFPEQPIPPLHSHIQQFLSSEPHGLLINQDYSHLPLLPAASQIQYFGKYAPTVFADYHR